MGSPPPSPPSERSLLLEPSDQNNGPPQSVPVEDDTLVKDSYSAFRSGDKHLIVFLVAAAGFFSPFSAFIYFPALKSIAASLGVTLELINLTVTTYLIVQGIVPSVIGDISENVGRRPVYLTIFIIYLVANIGLGLQNSYGALLVLRMLQSAGSSGTIALSYGVIADIAPPHQRGGYVGIAHVGFNSAASLGPVIGGLLTSKVSWRSIFWFLAVLSGTVFIALLIFLPETSRNLVGNGSTHATGINKSFVDRYRQRHMYMSSRVMTRSQLKLPNLLPCFGLIFRKDTALVLFTNAVFYMKYSCVQASLAPLLQDRYGLRILEVGFCYLASGAATAIASYGVGKIADYDYRQTAKAHGISIDHIKGDDLNEFPIEEARLRTVWLYIFISATATVVYGWTLEHHTHLAAPLAMQFLIGLAVTGMFNVCNTLVVDLHSDQAVTASASVSITRCFAAAVGVSVLQLLFEAIGPGWTFSLIGMLCYGTVPMLWLERKKGWQWRLERSKDSSLTSASTEAEDA
jgi:multidrug resistance protein